MIFYNLFLEYNLIAFAESPQAGAYPIPSELSGLQTFHEIAQQHLGLCAQKKVPPTLAVGERKALVELALWAKTQSLDRSGTLVTTLAECENRLAQYLKRQHIVHMLQRASSWHLIHLDKETVKNILQTRLHPSGDRQHESDSHFGKRGRAGSQVFIGSQLNPVCLVRGLDRGSPSLCSSPYSLKLGHPWAGSQMHPG